MLHGADVSGHQGPNWQPDPDDSFAFVKATEGSTYFSNDSVEQLRAARAKGLQVGHYHFMVPGNAAQQAAWFIEKADIRLGDLLVCDWENHKEGHPTVEDAAEFIAEVKRLRPGHQVGLYCNKSDWLNTAVKSGDFLWLAHYTTQTDVKGWSFWQYTNQPIDQNWAATRFNSLSELKTWANGLSWSDKYNAAYITWAGGRIIPLDRTILLACAKASGWGTIRLSQGGLSTSVAGSALTHAGLGVGDIAIDHRTRGQVWELCAALARSGFAPFPRGYGGDPWANQKHIHWGSRESASHAHQQLQDQIKEYLLWGDGLRGDGPYVGPRPPRGMWKDSPYNPANIQADTGIYYVNTQSLRGRDVDEKVVVTRSRGYRLQAAQQVYRWGRWNVVTSTPTYYALQYLSKDQPT